MYFVTSGRNEEIFGGIEGNRQQKAMQGVKRCILVGLEAA